MILAVDPVLIASLIAGLGYAAAVAGSTQPRWPTWGLVIGWLAHAAMLAADMAFDLPEGQGVRFGFAPVLSLAVWLVLAVHAVESRFVPLPHIRRGLASLAFGTVLLVLAFPGEPPVVSHTPWAPLHWILGIVSYGLFGAAVLHAFLLDNADRQMRQGAGSGAVLGMPLLKLERLTFRFVDAGFIVLTAAMAFGIGSVERWRWNDHKVVFTMLSWATFAALLAGRHLQGWRGRQATRWLYSGAGLLLLAYVGSRFVFEVLLKRVPPPT